MEFNESVKLPKPLYIEAKAELEILYLPEIYNKNYGQSPLTIVFQTKPLNHISMRLTFESNKVL